MLKHTSGIVFILLLTLSVFSPGWTQYIDRDPIHEDEYGAGITIAMSGIGLGGFYRFALPSYIHVGAELDFYIMRDKYEFTYYDYFTGYPRQINKFNRLFILPLSIELKRRLFYNSVEDDFRPYLIGTGGLTFGMNFPRNDETELSFLPEEERNRLPTDDEYRFSFNFGFGLGIDITSNESFFISIRPQYRFIYFPQSIAGENNHSSFEIRLELGKRMVQP
ncbi:MAG: hypothetical protein EH225_05815 [Calditrichaeota bacterium]|nr:hypothetical protein [Calditrichota bacterium]RQW04527.1 MAG: hypothetical protein EH225_05815 [Calditrichota bacterium]